MKQKLSKNDDFYIGLFLELGLNAIHPNEKAGKQAIEYTNNTQQPLIYNTIMDQQHYNDKQLKMYSIGFKLRYSIEFN